MGRRLAGYVPIHDGDTTTWYGPDDDIPDEVAAKIGDHAWIDDDKRRRVGAARVDRANPAADGRNRLRS